MTSSPIHSRGTVTLDDVEQAIYEAFGLGHQSDGADDAARRVLALFPVEAGDVAGEWWTDPNALHINMLRGGVAKLSPAQIGHLYRGEDAKAVVAEVMRQNPEAFAASPPLAEGQGHE